MGVLLDTTIFIDIERASSQHALSELNERLATCLGEMEYAGVAAVTASELLHGVHRATPAIRARREAFVETMLAAFPTQPFDLLAARAHARLWAHLAACGTDIGSHDRLIAATALSLGWRVATANVRHFKRVPGLEIVRVGLT
jgi:predicted nucleic acid-binding protein